MEDKILYDNLSDKCDRLLEKIKYKDSIVNEIHNLIINNVRFRHTDCYDINGKLIKKLSYKQIACRIEEILPKYYNNWEDTAIMINNIPDWSLMNAEGEIDINTLKKLR